MANVNVKLAGRCLVNGEIREKGEIVDLPEKAADGQPFATCFGEIVKPSIPKADDKKKDGV